MDDIKDIERRNLVSRFLNDQEVRTRPFGSNTAGERAYRKAERIAAALYLVTNHIQPGEPARVHVREDTLKLLSLILALRDEMRSESRLTVKVHVLIRNVMSLV